MNKVTIKAEDIYECEEVRFKAKLIPVEDCLIWTGSIAKDGYGRVGFRGNVMKPQRFAYAIAHGLKGYEVIGQKCKNKLCCNPKHLYDKSDPDRWTI